MEQPPLSTRITKRDSLLRIRGLGFKPTAVFDVGAQVGTMELYETFPESVHILIEPVQENEPRLKSICDALPNATYMIAAAGRASEKGTLLVSKNYLYSGLIPEESAEESETHFPREIQTVALDDLVSSSGVKGPYLLKIDVDGSEIDVLTGSVKMLKETGYAVIESTLFGSAQIHHVIDFMKDEGFVIYDILEPLYRPLDGALWQVDIAFVPSNSFLRSKSAYAFPEALRSLYRGV